MNTYLNLITTWRLLYVAIIATWTIILSSNQIKNKDNWKKSFPDSQLDGNNWIHIGAGIGLGAGILVVLTSLWALSWDRGRWDVAGSMKGRIMRTLMEIGCSVASICVIAIASIYFYVHNAAQEDHIDGMSYSVQLGGVFLVMVIIDAIFFRPTLTYSELMSCCCYRAATNNTRINTRLGTFVPCRSVYESSLINIIGAMPFLGSMGGGGMDTKGIPLVLLVNGIYDEDQKQHFREAALDLKAKLDQLYEDTHTISNPMLSG